MADTRWNREEEKVKTSHLGGCQAGRRSDGFLLPLIPLLIAVPLWFCLNQMSKQSKHGWFNSGIMDSMNAPATCKFPCLDPMTYQRPTIGPSLALQNLITSTANASGTLPEVFGWVLCGKCLVSTRFLGAQTCKHTLVCPCSSTRHRFN